MRPLTRILSENSPRNKPELWQNLGETLRRRAAAWLNGALDPEWWSKPFIATIRPENLLIEVIPGDVVGKPIVYFGVYEFAVSALLREYLAQGDVFVDVGANIGYYTLLASSIVGDAGLVVAFEPSLRIRNRLKRNVTLNQLSRVDIRAEAVGREAGVVRLIEPEAGNNDGLAYIARGNGDRGAEVRAVRLDQVESLSKRVPTLMKVDVEGGEPDVFAGAEQLLVREDAPSIVFESFDLVRDANQLKSFGYRVYQPTLANGLLRLTADLGAAPYRGWEAPNFLAVKSPRGRAFAERLLVGS